MSRFGPFVFNSNGSVLVFDQTDNKVVQRWGTDTAIFSAVQTNQLVFQTEILFAAQLQNQDVVLVGTSSKLVLFSNASAQEIPLCLLADAEKVESFQMDYAGNTVWMTISPNARCIGVRIAPNNNNVFEVLIGGDNVTPTASSKDPQNQIVFVNEQGELRDATFGEIVPSAASKIYASAAAVLRDTTSGELVPIAAASSIFASAAVLRQEESGNVFIVAQIAGENDTLCFLSYQRPPAPEKKESEPAKTTPSLTNSQRQANRQRFTRITGGKGGGSVVVKRKRVVLIPKKAAAAKKSLAN